MICMGLSHGNTCWASLVWREPHTSPGHPRETGCICHTSLHPASALSHENHCSRLPKLSITHSRLDNASPCLRAKPKQMSFPSHCHQNTICNFDQWISVGKEGHPQWLFYSFDVLFSGIGCLWEEISADMERCDCRGASSSGFSWVDGVESDSPAVDCLYLGSQFD